MATVLSIANQKGGVGKTTTAINLAAALSLAGVRCLVVDADPQCNATTGLGTAPLARHPWLSNQSLDQFVQPTDDGPYLLAGSPCRADADALSAPNAQRLTLIQRRFTVVLSQYDLVLIDCPPTLGQITRIALTLSDSVLIPLQCEYFAMEGLALMSDLVRHVAGCSNGRPNIAGILLNQFDSDWQLDREVAEEVRRHLGSQVLRTVVPRDEAISAASSHGKSVLTYDIRSRGALAYVLLALEVAQRLGLRCEPPSLDRSAATVPDVNDDDR